jgi:uncharacterized protein YecA (UPF0149 family)
LSQWARGFLQGHDWLGDLWDAYTPEDLDEELGGILMVLSFFSSRRLAQAYLEEVTRKRPTLEEFAADMLRLFPTAMESYAHLGLSIQQALREHPPEPARSEKAQCNAPCPCGSDKKYKKCCGAH